jgi:3-hydroxyisobutyrate dehydrogenase
MGKSMCGHLLKAGYTLNVFNRTKEKADDLVKEGAHWMEPEELAKNSDVVILMLGYPQDVERMTIGSKGIFEHMKKGYI